jgi:hypothetical protein
VNFTEYLELVDRHNESLLIEGISYDLKTKTVKFSNNVESLNTNPFENPTNHNVLGIHTLSIFKRVRNSDNRDGNPLIHALKGKYGWSIDQESLNVLFRQFIKITKKIRGEFDTIIKVQSTNHLNTKLLYQISRIIPHKHEISDLFVKLNAVDVRECVDYSKMSDDDINVIENDFKKMIKSNNGIFSYSMLSYKSLRSHIKTGCAINGQKMSEYAPLINDKRILLLDDTVMSGKSLSDSAIAIKDTYSPSNITALTLFSPL